jgi:twitching motility two-component system response regulator PilG
MDSAPKVLIIDDDEDFRASLRSMLESGGYGVAEADSGTEALRKLPECRPDAILCDVMMDTPVEGYGVTYTLRNNDEYAAWRDTPLFMISSIEQSPDELFPQSMYTELIRPDRYIAKPIRMERLLELLRTALAAGSAKTRA